MIEIDLKAHAEVAQYPNDSPMQSIHITATKEFLHSLTSSTPISAIAELVWNGLDAGSNEVSVRTELNGMGGIQSIRVSDTGTGMSRENITTFFGNLGDSWKKNTKVNGRALHGKNGKGRFKAFAIGSRVEWETVYQATSGEKYLYKIIGNADALDNFQFSDAVVADIHTGTEVEISNISQEFRNLLDDRPVGELTRVFALYLSQYPSVNVHYNGYRIDAAQIQEFRKDYHIDDLKLPLGGSASLTISVIEWKVPTKRAIYLCDANGASLQEIEAGQAIPARGFEFTGYVKSDRLSELDKDNILILEDAHPDLGAIIKATRLKMKEHFRTRALQERGKIVQRWKEEDIYPYDDSIETDTVKKVESQVFDILAASVQSYLPSFEDTDRKSRRFTFRLLAQALQQNPDSVQKLSVKFWS